MKKGITIRDKINELYVRECDLSARKHSVENKIKRLNSELDYINSQIEDVNETIAMCHALRSLGEKPK